MSGQTEKATVPLERTQPHFNRELLGFNTLGIKQMKIGSDQLKTVADAPKLEKLFTIINIIDLVTQLGPFLELAIKKNGVLTIKEIEQFLPTFLKLLRFSDIKDVIRLDHKTKNQLELIEGAFLLPFIPGLLMFCLVLNYTENIAYVCCLPAILSTVPAMAIGMLAESKKEQKVSQAIQQYLPQGLNKLAEALSQFTHTEAVNEIMKRFPNPRQALSNDTHRLLTKIISTPNLNQKKFIEIMCNEFNLMIYQRNLRSESNEYPFLSSIIKLFPNVESMVIKKLPDFKVILAAPDIMEALACVANRPNEHVRHLVHRWRNEWSLKGYVRDVTEEKFSTVSFGLNNLAKGALLALPDDTQKVTTQVEELINRLQAAADPNSN
ncbi:MAG TPA: hypothetical protein VD999_04435 [Vitreimonas sp.]|nr:hypothetical protein [Vitreimonas sp.]